MRLLFKRSGFFGCMSMLSIISLATFTLYSSDQVINPVRAGGQTQVDKPSKVKPTLDGQVEDTTQRVVRSAGNSIYQVFVDDAGLYTATTGAAHPSGAGLNVLFGNGRPGTTFNTIRSYTTGIDYLQTIGTQSGNIFPLGNFATVTPIGTTGFRTSYVLPGGSTTPDAMTVIQDINVNGTTFDDSTIEVTTTVVNTGSTSIQTGIRYLWDYQIANDDGPTFQELAPDNAVRTREAEFVPPGFAQYRIVDNDQNPNPPTFFILGSTNGPITLTPTPVPPDLMQFACWPSAAGTIFDYTINPALEIASINSSCGGGGGDTAVLYYFGQNRANAINLPAGTRRTVSASMFLITAAGADLAISQTASPTTATSSSNITYNITVTNNDTQNAARFVTVNDNLPPALNFVSCAATGGGVCSGTGNNRAISFPSLAPGASANITLVGNVNCATAAGPSIMNTATVSASTSDPNPSNNSSTTVVSLTSSGSSSNTISVGKSSVNFGAVTPGRELSSSPPSDTFTVENPGCAQALLNFSIVRTGSDVSSGRIVNPDDTVLYQLKIINPGGSETTVPIGPGTTPFQIPAGQTSNFRIQFNPLIPILAGRTTGLFANQVLPDLITSQLRITPSGGSPLAIDLTGIIATPVKLIHPMDSRLAPLILFSRSGDQFTIECSTHDSNLDLYLARYQFLDQNGRSIGSPVDVDLVQPIAQRSLVRGQSFSIVQTFNGASQQSGINKVQVTLFDRESVVTSSPATLGATQPTLASVSAASFSDSALASESIVSTFGGSLASGVQSASSTPLPTSLAGVRVDVRDGAGIERASRLFFVSPDQINFQIPTGTMVGAGTITVYKEDRVAARQAIQISNTSPGLFSANANGEGAAAAVALRIDGKGTQQYEPVAQFEQSQNRFVTRSLDPGIPGKRLFLALFGTGIRFSNSSNVVVRIGGIDVPAIYAGAQGSFVGLDQINVPIPIGLAGRGEVDVAVIVDGKISNPVKVRFGGSSATAVSNRTEIGGHDNGHRQPSIYRATTSVMLPTLKLTPQLQGRRHTSVEAKEK